MKDRIKESIRLQLHRDNKRIWIDSHKSKPCSDCGGIFPPYVMQFDHRPDENKFRAISQMWSYGKDVILREISKCDVVCGNCHAIRTHDRKQYRKNSTAP